MKKRILATVLALLMLLTMTACGGGGSVVGTWTLDLSTAGSTQDLTDLTGVSGEGVYVTSFVFNDNGYYLADVGSAHGDHVHDIDNDSSGQYTVGDGVITFDGEVEYQYSVSGSELTITDAAGNTFTYTK